VVILLKRARRDQRGELLQLRRILTRSATGMDGRGVAWEVSSKLPGRVL
jgi:hypothetical protein